MRLRPLLLTLGCLAAIALAATCAAPPAHAQTARAHVSADSVRIGERFRLAGDGVAHAAGAALFPAASDSAGFGDLVVIGRRAPTGDSATYEVTTFALEGARLPPLPVRVVAGEDTALLRTNALRVPVRRTLPPDAAELRPPTPPAPFPRPLWPWLAGGALALAAALALLVYVLRRSRTGREGSAPEPQPHVQVRRRLARLRPAAPDGAKVFHTALSDALRTYLARRLGLPAHEQTTPELLAALRRPPHAAHVPSPATERLARVLTQADLVKFADRRPPAEVNAEMLREAGAAVDAVEPRVRARAAQARAARADEARAHPDPAPSDAP